MEKVFIKVTKYIFVFLGLFIGGSVGTYQGLNAYTNSQISHTEIKIKKRTKVNHKIVKRSQNYSLHKNKN